MAFTRWTDQTGGVPDDAAGDGDSKAASYRRWLRGLTLWQYALFAGVMTFALATVMKAVSSAIWTKPLPWGWVVVITVVVTVILTFVKRDALRQGKEHPADEDLTDRP